MNNEELATKYASKTMIARQQFVQNLDIVDMASGVTGAIVECGTWRGGMLAAMLEKRPDSLAIGFDSFEGLPAAQPIDGSAAIAWQADTESPIYFDNCSASMREFMDTMLMTSLNFDVIKGWFSETIPKFVKDRESLPIAILRLDGDWYDSTKICLDYLYSMVVPNGVVIIDDYYAWQGCKKATDEFLKKNKNLKLITVNQVAYFRKTK